MPGSHKDKDVFALRILRSTLVATALLFTLLSTSVQARLWVVCIGEDGHWSFETGVDGTCGAESDHAGEGHAEGRGISALADADHCGPCLDLSLDNPQTRSESVAGRGYASGEGTGRFFAGNLGVTPWPERGNAMASPGFPRSSSLCHPPVIALLSNPLLTRRLLI